MDKFFNLPGPVKGGVAAGGGGLVVAGVLIGTGQWLFFGVLLLFLALCFGGYFLWRRWQRKKQAARMTNDMQQLSSASPRAISDLGARARLDDMRKKFEKGISEYRARGKDLYTLPWYVFVGTPGSGKTEAIRHSNVGFPPGMQDEFQGTGGTINMDWWFTNHAVILDTAGRLMFEEVKPGEQSEWKEFLTLLKKNRPNCPINGLFLVIPSDSLIKESADEIAKQAGIIAQRLDLIQRVLDVRFPVYVIITKCDKINGFREFFDDLRDPQLQHQMMGWSNPDPLDTPFRADLVDQHLDKVVNRLRRRRMGVLRDPAAQAENPAARRADEVDALFALPQSLALLGPRLRRYLETIFVAGEWSAKPLFLRGIYFTSSMREGAALDEELAKAIGLGVEDLGDEKIWERERAYFLRDLLIDKVFREKGLVTRATNTSRMLRSRQLAMYGAGSAALVLFILFAWFSLGDLSKSVGSHSDTWQKVKSAGWHNNKIWKQSIVPVEGAGYADRIINNVVIGKTDKPIGEFHAELRREAIKPAKRSFLFPGVSRSFQAESRRAQRVIFENGVVRPLVEATRLKIEHGNANAASMDRLPGALAALLELEGAALIRKKDGSPVSLSAGDAERFLGSLMRFVAGQDVPVPSKLAMTMAETYADDDGGVGWPSPWLGKVAPTNRLAQSQTINSALNQLEAYALRNVETRKEAWKKATALRDQVLEFEKLERDLFSAAGAADTQKLKRTLAALGPVATNIDEQLKTATNSTLFQSGLSFTNAYQQFQAVVSSQATEDVDKVRQANARALGRMTSEFLRDVDRRLGEVREAVGRKVSEAKQSDDATVLARLDGEYLFERRYEKRWQLYRLAYENSVDRAFREDLVGGRAEPLQERLANHQKHLGEALEYKGVLAESVQKTLKAAWAMADAVQRQRFREDYLTQATNKIKSNIRFPLCLDPKGTPLDPTHLEQVAGELARITRDMGAQPVQHAIFISDAAWTGFATRVSNYHGLANALLDPNRKPISYEVSLAPYDNDLDREKWRDSFGYIAIGGSNNDPKLTRNTAFEKLGEFSIDQAITFILQDGPTGKRVNGPALGQWSGVRLLFEDPQATRNADNSWSVRLPTGLTGRSAGEISMRIKFPVVLPDKKNWCGPL
jgi:hypothetical protein